MFYTGVGSRETPNDVMKVMYKFAQKMALHGAVLRSGGADGADTAFEWGCDKKQGMKEIYLPWNGFNGRSLTGLCGASSSLFPSLTRNLR